MRFWKGLGVDFWWRLGLGVSNYRKNCQTGCASVFVGTGGGSGPGRVRAPVRFKPPGAKAGICERGGFLGKTVKSNKNGVFWDLGMPSTSCILDVSHSGKLRFSARSEASSLFFWLWSGRLRLEKSVLSGKAWTNKKILVYQTRKLRSSARSEASSLFFALLSGQLRLAKSVLSGKAWTNKKILVFQTRKLRSSARSEVQKQVPFFSRFCLGSYGWKNWF